MIKNYEEKRRLSIHGDTADIFLGISAEAIPTVDARAVSEQFDQFLGRINGSQIKRPPSPGTVTNFSKGPWSPEEKAAIMTVPEDEAWANYQKHFPKSSRTKHTVRRMRTYLLEKGATQSPVPSCIEIKGIKGSTLTTVGTSTGPIVDRPNTQIITLIKAPPSKKKEAKPVVEKRRTNKYGIPSSLATTDKKTYQRLWYRCKVQGIMYEEALAQEGTMKRGKRPATSPAAPEKKPRKAPIKKERLPFHQTQAGGSSSSNEQVITSGTPATASPLPTVYQSSGPVHQGLQLKAGDRVRHNGSKASPHYGKEGQILKVDENGVAFVKFGEVSTWLSPNYLAAVTGAGA